MFPGITDGVKSTYNSSFSSFFDKGRDCSHLYQNVVHELKDLSKISSDSFENN